MLLSHTRCVAKLGLVAYMGGRWWDIAFPLLFSMGLLVEEGRLRRPVLIKKVLYSSSYRLQQTWPPIPPPTPSQGNI